MCPLHSDSSITTITLVSWKLELRKFFHAWVLTEKVFSFQPECSNTLINKKVEKGRARLVLQLVFYWNFFLVFFFFYSYLVISCVRFFFFHSLLLSRVLSFFCSGDCATISLYIFSCFRWRYPPVKCISVNKSIRSS